MLGAPSLLASSKRPRANKAQLTRTIPFFPHRVQGKLTATGEVSAVKVVELKEDELKETLLEMEILAGTKHLNITRFMGMFLKNLDLWVCVETGPSDSEAE